MRNPARIYRLKGSCCGKNEKKEAGEKGSCRTASVRPAERRSAISSGISAEKHNNLPVIGWEKDRRQEWRACLFMGAEVFPAGQGSPGLSVRCMLPAVQGAGRRKAG